ncbi:MAG: 4-amino-4-deoxychorismate lyase [Actinobacteria bacterium]|nr:MAG: 4-amino-4-deoxychorismate lyase [Actinomycetota bacterium]
MDRSLRRAIGSGSAASMAIMERGATDRQHDERSLACLDGELVPIERACIPVTDEGLLRGDGVFEVVRLYEGRPFALDRHLERMSRSAANLLLPFDRAAVEEDARALLGAAKSGDALLRVLVTRGGHRVALVEPLPALPQSLALGGVTYAPTIVLDGVKSLSYAANMLAGRLARERGFDEALLVSPQGSVLECPTASFFWVRAGELLTPPLEEHVLASITRQLIMAVTDAREQPTSLEDLASAEEAFVASSVREVLPVHTIEQLELPAPGPVTDATAAAVRAEIETALARAVA